jgi:deoxycytidylate deaminase
MYCNVYDDACDIAKRCALQSKMKQKHGAVIILDGRVISYGWNHTIKGSSTGKGNDANSFHAEVDALCRMQKKYMALLPRCTMYVVRVTADATNFRNSKPCERCRRTIELARIGKTIYSVDPISA